MYDMIVAIARLRIDSLIVAHTKKRDHCYKDGNDEYKKSGILRIVDEDTFS